MKYWILGLITLFNIASLSVLFFIIKKVGENRRKQLHILGDDSYADTKGMHIVKTLYLCAIMGFLLISYLIFIDYL